MPGVFLSHSSQDKPFVTRLALDLVSRSIPVWLDSWQMAPGDSLLQRIYEGIDSSTVVVLVLSEHSVASRWVQKELTGALTKEEQLGRRFLIPIRVSKCEAPLMIADRLYADFTEGYLDAMERLSEQIRALGVAESIPAEQEIIPLFFTRGRFLNEVHLRNRITELVHDLPNETILNARQFVASPDENLTELRQRFTRRLENVTNDPYYSPQLENDLTARYVAVRGFESSLQEGMAQIVNMFAMRARNAIRAAHICHWYARIVRTYLLDILWESQLPTSALAYGRECALSTLHRAEYAARLFDVDAAVRCAVGPPHTFDDAATGVWVDAAARFLKSFDVYERMDIAETGSETVEKWIIPQISFQYIREGKSIPSEIDDWLISTP